MRSVLVIALLIAAAPVGWRAVEACGDKFLIVGRAMRLQQAYAAVHPGNIVIYARPSTNAAAAIRDPQFQKSLRQAGHAVSVIEDFTLFQQALASSSFDIVLADLAEAPKIDSLVASSPSHPKPLYVLYPSAIEQKGLQSQYMCKLKSSDRATRYLDLIDDEMKARAPRRGQKS